MGVSTCCIFTGPDCDLRSQTRVLRFSCLVFFLPWEYCYSVSLVWHLLFWSSSCFSVFTQCIHKYPTRLRATAAHNSYKSDDGLSALLACFLFLSTFLCCPDQHIKPLASDYTSSSPLPYQHFSTATTTTTIAQLTPKPTNQAPGQNVSFVYYI